MAFRVGRRLQGMDGGGEIVRRGALTPAFTTASSAPSSARSDRRRQRVEFVADAEQNSVILDRMAIGVTVPEEAGGGDRIGHLAKVAETIFRARRPIGVDGIFDAAAHGKACRGPVERLRSVRYGDPRKGLRIARRDVGNG